MNKTIAMPITRDDVDWLKQRADEELDRYHVQTHPQTKRLHLELFLKYFNLWLKNKNREDIIE
jgi:hypothetical protein